MTQPAPAPGRQTGRARPVRRMTLSDQLAALTRHAGSIVEIRRGAGGLDTVVGLLVSVAVLGEVGLAVVNEQPGSYVGTAVPFAEISTVRRLT